MATINKQVTSPAGRIIRGDPWLLLPAMDFNDPTKPKLNKAGEHIHNRYIGLAIPKNHPGWEAFWAEIYNVGLQGYNNVVPANISWKFDDGDDPKFANKEGFPGCWIVNMTNQFEVGIYDENGNQILVQSELTCGDYADVLVDIACDGHTSMPSVYLAQKIIRRAGRGEQIRGGPDIGDMAPSQGMATGSSAVRTGTAAPIATAPQVTSAQSAAPPAPVTTPPAPVAPSVPPVPTAGTTSPSDAPPAPPPPLPTGPQMTAKAAGATYEAMIGVGWTDEVLISEGMMVAAHPGFVAGPPA